MSSSSAPPPAPSLISEGDSSNWNHASFFTRFWTFSLWSLLIPLGLVFSIPISIFRKCTDFACNRGNLWQVFSITFVSFTLSLARVHVLFPWYTMRLGCFLQARLNSCCRRRVLKVEKMKTTVDVATSHTVFTQQLTNLNIGPVTYDLYSPTGVSIETAKTIVIHAVGGFRFCMPSRFYAYSIGSLVLHKSKDHDSSSDNATIWAMVRYTTTGLNPNACVENELQVKEVRKVFLDLKAKNPTAKIVLSGDSVGANIVLCAAMDMKNANVLSQEDGRGTSASANANSSNNLTTPKNPMPDALLLHCPVYDSYHAPLSPHKNYYRDFLTPEVFQLSRRLYHGAASAKDNYESNHRHAKIDPKMFAQTLTDIPVLVTLGGKDLLVDVGKQLYDDLKEHGVNATLYTAENGVHNFMFLNGIDFTMMTWLTNRKEVKEAHDRIRKFIRELK
ncbi:unnamed protein product [Amoebophrya sp. A120]|nr:unnamed protein product [Amoebophrya sp. A120]|eukprot:GSA120T00023759001.1